MAANFSLTAGCVGNCHFLLWEVGSPCNLIVIPKTPLYEGMLVWYRYPFCSFSSYNHQKIDIENHYFAHFQVEIAKKIGIEN